MTKLVNQPTAKPTRKIWAGFIAAALVGACRGVTDLLWPELDLGAIYHEAELWLVAGIPVVVSYFTKEAV